MLRALILNAFFLNQRKREREKKGAPYLFDLGIVRQYIAPAIFGRAIFPQPCFHFNETEIYLKTFNI